MKRKAFSVYSNQCRQVRRAVITHTWNVWLHMFMNLYNVGVTFLIESGWANKILPVVPVKLWLDLNKGIHVGICGCKKTKFEKVHRGKKNTLLIFTYKENTSISGTQCLTYLLKDLCRKLESLCKQMSPSEMHWHSCQTGSVSLSRGLLAALLRRQPATLGPVRF